ncbi:sigma-70 family RNA polymerase sigma factor [Streptomyces sp. A7024]|uniref:RNA polymerase sigma factor n=1 Tax=Streptomyces coryli TaxID=1128680 RepID=A0A6G4U931_9ACTN|nr:sigma-70 family RNA polymerase sigma factor [Streptomyces coryli]
MVARVRAGETEAYAELVRAHAPLAHRLAILLGAGAEAEDVVQTAFIKAYRALGSFRDGAAFRPWLLRIVANETKNTMRASARYRAARERVAVAEGLRRGGERPGVMGVGATGPGAAGPGWTGPELPAANADADPAAAALSAERREELLRALRGLREPHRLVVVHRYLLDLDEAETAAALGIPRGTVKSRLSRALTQLRRELGEDGAVGGGGAP